MFKELIKIVTNHKCCSSCREKEVRYNRSLWDNCFVLILALNDLCICMKVWAPVTKDQHVYIICVECSKCHEVCLMIFHNIMREGNMVCVMPKASKFFLICKRNKMLSIYLCKKCMCI